MTRAPAPRDKSDRTIEPAARSEAQWRAIFENAAVGIVLVSRAGIIVDCNRRFARYLGYRPDEVIGLYYHNQTPSEHDGRDRRAKEGDSRAVPDATRARQVDVQDNSVLLNTVLFRLLTDPICHDDAMAKMALGQRRVAAGGSRGIDAVNEILASQTCPVIFAIADPERLLTGLRPEPAFLMTKPFEREVVLATVRQAIWSTIAGEPALRG